MKTVNRTGQKKRFCPDCSHTNYKSDGKRCWNCGGLIDVKPAVQNPTWLGFMRLLERIHIAPAGRLNVSIDREDIMPVTAVEFFPGPKGQFCLDFTTEPVPAGSPAAQALRAARKPMPFTVILLYPDHVADNYGETWCGMVEARDAVEAGDIAQRKVARQSKCPSREDDFKLVSIFAGNLVDQVGKWYAAQ